MQRKNKIPKKIFFLWLQGIDNAPPIIQHCYRSWIKYNQNYDIVLLSRKNLNNYIDIRWTENKAGITDQALSDIIRINLLNKFGGVWVDATCFCTKSLDEWLPKYTEEGFFAFNRPGPDRLISSWFLVSAKNNYLINKLHYETNNYWKNNELHTPSETKKIDRYLSTKFTKNVDHTKIWFHLIIKKILKIYPYFWFHYLFAETIKKYPKSKYIWDKTKKYNANIPHMILFNGLSNKPTKLVLKSIMQIESPLYKLTYKEHYNFLNKNCTLNILLNKHLDYAE